MKRMDVCTFCKKEITQVTSCSANGVVRYTDGVEMYSIPVTLVGDCRYCKAKHGKYHHAGCFNEICPRCNGQMLTCRCKKAPID